MKAQPMKLESGSFIPCESADATHIRMEMPGPFRNRMIPVITKGSRRDHERPVWTWNGDTEKPTLKPSVATWTPAIPREGDLPPLPEIRCHTWITDGQAIFLSDCTHEFANQTLDLLDIEP